ncbi:asparagine synthase (glutamine-hydrolyzing) [Muricoccus radiodurans]|uniref:asparagine synthase (glutamine-hydrolyzing) n=1 Tax=Muricoccus radiodurans TaxID=2231721 RepID=UPI003CF9271A
MCGIAGIHDPSHCLSPEERRAAVARMSACLAHRGPDDDGIFADDTAGIALGFRRLAIMDLSAAGAQPMRSHDGRCVIAYNGEIYNHAALREALPRNWRGHSDTEPLLEHLSQHGPAGTLPRLDGMFALAFWDGDARTLTLARDRMGEKPLYWTAAGGVLAFASELKALASLPWLERRPDRAALSLFLRHGFITAPHTAWDGIFRLPAAHSLTAGPHGIGAPVAYWDSAVQPAPFAGTAEEAEERLDALLREAASSRRESDVPLGVLLSGGLDSSAVTAALCASGPAPRSFAIAFPGTRYDEAPHAAAIARHLGTDHLEIPVTEAEAVAAMPELPGIWDEPFADPSAIPTLLLCRAVRPHVTVALGGDGGDELFAGYPRHWRAAAHRPQRLAALGRHLPAPRGARTARIARRLALAADPDPATDHRAALSLWHASDRVFPETPPRTLLDDPAARPPGLSPRRLSLWLDARTYLPEDLLTKVDRAAMSASLEVRAPMLSNDLVAFAASLPEAMLTDGTRGKLILRRVLARHVPPALFERPKQGFEPPLAAWLRGGLRDWAAALLDPARLARGGLIANVPLVTAMWREHTAGRRNHAYRLWAVLMLAAWAERERL